MTNHSIATIVIAIVAIFAITDATIMPAAVIVMIPDVRMTVVDMVAGSSEMVIMITALAAHSNQNSDMTIAVPGVTSRTLVSTRYKSAPA